MVTTVMGSMRCSVCTLCGYTVYTLAEPVLTLPEAGNAEEVQVEAEVTVTRVETAVVETVAEDEEAVPADAVLVVNEATFEVPVEILPEAQVKKVFAVNILQEGQSIQPTAAVRIRIPVEEKEVSELEGKKLVLMQADGTLVEIPYEIINGELVFETELMGVFLLVDELTELQN